MKLCNLTLTILTVSVANGSPVTDFEPERITYDSLTHGGSTGSEEPLLDALSTDGIISITEIPHFSDMKKSVMTWLHSCIMDQGTDAAHVLETIENDGTIRRTFGSKTTPPGPDGGQIDFMVRSSAEEEISPACVKFSENLSEFRTKVGEVTQTFADRLTLEMGESYHMPIMTTEDGKDSFRTIADIVASGDHLEHFHSYQKLEQPNRNESSLRSRTDQTIDLHTDQGFFIAFTPGLMVTHLDGKPDLSTDLWETEGFYIEKANGSTAHVHFTADDDLVFMMGDGVNQYINPSIKNSRTLRAVPHSVTLNTHAENLSRAWYVWKKSYSICVFIFFP